MVRRVARRACATARWTSTAAARASSTSTAQVDEAELARLAEFGKDRPDPSGGSERGLTAQEITTYMDANFERAKGTRRWIDRQLMDGEWPVLLNIMGKGEGERTLSQRGRGQDAVRRAAAARADRRAPGAQPAPAGSRRFASSARPRSWLVAIALRWRLWRSPNFPTRSGRSCRQLAQLLPPPLPDRAPAKAAYWLDQNWSTEDRHWFHHASQGTATFPVPYDWFMALEQPGLHLFTPARPAQRQRLSRTVRLPAQPEIHPHRRGDACAASAMRDSSDAKPSRRRHLSQACGRRRSRISTACRSVSRG